MTDYWFFSGYCNILVERVLTIDVQSSGCVWFLCSGLLRREPKDRFTIQQIRAHECVFTLSFYSRWFC